MFFDMSDVIKIKNGLTINLVGEAEKVVTEINPKYCAIKPIDFVGLFPKLLIQEGDPVKAGYPFILRQIPRKILCTSPISGTVKELRRGEKRVLLEIVIESDGKDTAVDFGKADPNKLTREEIIEKMLIQWYLADDSPTAIFNYR